MLDENEIFITRREPEKTGVVVVTQALTRNQAKLISPSQLQVCNCGF